MRAVTFQEGACRRSVMTGHITALDAAEIKARLPRQIDGGVFLLLLNKIERGLLDGQAEREEQD